MVPNLQPYPEYKDSAVSWLGKVPSRWDVNPGLAVLREEQVKNTGMREKTVLSLSYGRIVVKPTDKLHGLVPESFETYQIVEPGDIIIRSTDLQNDWNSLRVGLVRNRGIITSAYICLKMRGQITPDYGFRLLHTYDLKKVFYGMGSGLRQNLDWTDFKRMPIPVPPREEQNAIVRFLDAMDHQFNRLIKAKRRLIDILNEQKQAVIHRAVTRGLHHPSRVKPSDISWVHEIAENWDVLRSKYLFREVDARSSTGQETRLSMSQKLGLVPSSRIEVRRLFSESGVGMKVCEKGDIVLNRLKAHLGVFALAPERGLVSPDYTVFRPIRPMQPRYFELVYRTPACRVELRKRAKGIVQGFWRLYTDDFYDIRVPVPPLPEQERIVVYLDTELHTTNAAIDRAYREIDLIREYRTRLVADVVTGQLDVRAAVANLPDHPAESQAVAALDEETEDETPDISETENEQEN